MTPEQELEIIGKFNAAVRAAQLATDVLFPKGHQYAGKTKAQVREEIMNGVFVPAPEFMPGLEEIPDTPIEAIKKKGAEVVEAPITNAPTGKKNS